ncbi:MAG TPA: hypothetical protein PK593_06930 [Thermomicrobiales bacterium]|nr:hypothetical protein [Thermomicrobiales bacterium]HRA30327.1 hypothetical protein [Thermomicrobiales bacterium]
MYTRPAAGSDLVTSDGPRRNDRHTPASPGIMDIIERLESQVVAGRRVMGKVMIDENEFFLLLDQLRQAVPAELHQARRVIQQRQEIILGAQDEAERVVATARERAEYLLSERGLTAEARYVGENVLRHAHDNADSAMIEMKRFAQQMLDDVEAAMNRNLSEIAEARSRLSD